jgi:hypothetical protein
MPGTAARSPACWPACAAGTWLAGRLQQQVDTNSGASHSIVHASASTIKTARSCENYVQGACWRQEGANSAEASPRDRCQQGTDCSCTGAWEQHADEVLATGAIMAAMGGRECSAEEPEAVGYPRLLPRGLAVSPHPALPKSRPDSCSLVQGPWRHDCDLQGYICISTTHEERGSAL